MTDIVERFREAASTILKSGLPRAYQKQLKESFTEAADEIERLKGEVKQIKSATLAYEKWATEGLSTAQLENKRLREALSAFITHMSLDEDEWNTVTFKQARQALQTPPDDSALREFVADEMVKAAEAAESEFIYTILKGYAERYSKGDV